MTANMQTPHPIKVTSTGAIATTPLIVYNRNTGVKVITEFKTSSPTNITLGSTGGLFSYSQGDVIELTVVGVNEGSNTYTVSGGSGSVSVTVATSAAPGVTI